MKVEDGGVYIEAGIDVSKIEEGVEAGVEAIEQLGQAAVDSSEALDKAVDDTLEALKAIQKELNGLGVETPFDDLVKAYGKASKGIEEASGKIADFREALEDVEDSEAKEALQKMLESLEGELGAAQTALDDLAGTFIKKLAPALAKGAIAIGVFAAAAAAAYVAIKKITERSREIDVLLTEGFAGAANGYGDLLAAYTKAKALWESAAGDVDKLNKIIREHRKELDATGIAITNVNDGDAAFVDNTKAVLDAYKKRAAAQAYELAARAAAQKAADEYLAAEEAAAKRRNKRENNPIRVKKILALFAAASIGNFDQRHELEEAWDTNKDDRKRDAADKKGYQQFDIAVEMSRKATEAMEEYTSQLDAMGLSTTEAEQAARKYAQTLYQLRQELIEQQRLLDEMDYADKKGNLENREYWESQISGWRNVYNTKFELAQLETEREKEVAKQALDDEYREYQKRTEEYAREGYSTSMLSEKYAGAVEVYNAKVAAADKKLNDTFIKLLVERTEKYIELQDKYIAWGEADMARDAENVNAREAEYDDLIQKYGTYEEKRLAIHMKWLGKINAADEEHREVYERAMKKELKALADAYKKLMEADWYELGQQLESVAEKFAAIGNNSQIAAAKAISFLGSVSTNVGQLSTLLKQYNEAKDKEKGEAERDVAALGLIGTAISVAVKLGDEIRNVQKAQDAAAKSAEDYAEALRDLDNAARLDALGNAFGTDKFGQLLVNLDIARESLDAIGKTMEGWKHSDYGNQFGQGVLEGVFGKNYDLVSDNRSWLQRMFGFGKIDTADFEDFFTDGAFDGDKLTEWYKIYGEGLVDADKAVVEQLIADWDDYKNAIKSIEGFMTDMFGNVADSIADKMLTSFLDTGDAISDLTDLMGNFERSVAKSIVTSMLMKNVFTDEAQEAIADALATGNVGGAIELFEGLMDKANATAPAITDFLKSLDLDAASEARTASSPKGIAQASQDSVDELNGRMTAIQGHTYAIKENTDAMRNQMADILDYVAGIHDDTSSMDGKLDDILAQSTRTRSALETMVDRGVQILR